jgi:hypothetical protein
MMDIVPSQGRLAAEINRVLVEGGVWIDFSLPLAMSAEDQFNSLNLSTFLEQSGFDLLDRKMHRVDVLDLSSLTEWAWSSRQTPIMFVAKKVSELATPRYNYFAEYFAKKGEAIWDKVPKRVVDIALTNERRFTNSGVQESKGLTVLRPNNPRAGSFKVSHQTAAMTESHAERFRAQHPTRPGAPVLQRSRRVAPDRDSLTWTSETSKAFIRWRRRRRICFSVASLRKHTAASLPSR